MKNFSVVIIAVFISFSAFVYCTAQTSSDAQASSEEQALYEAQAYSDADIEARARIVGRSIRCVVCQNQSIDESDASLAQDMRILVRARLRAGDSNEDVIKFLQTRYGDFVLLKPPVQGNTYLLWFAPAILLGLLLLWYVRRVRRKSVVTVTKSLTADELKRFKKLATVQENDK